jgi:hypothetical protein
MELKEQIYKGFYKFSFDEAFTRLSEYLDQYKIKRTNKKLGEIILDASYPYKLFLWSTWIKHIVIKIERKGTNLAEIDIYGKPVLSPHHIFKELYYRRIKIDISKFKEDFKKAFQKYEWRG